MSCGLVQAVAQTTSAQPGSPVPAPRTSAPAQFQGSVPSENPVPGRLALTLDDAIQRGLKQNLGLVLGDLNTHLAEADRLRALSELLPHSLNFQMHQILLEAKASEQSARMVAMKNATDNAKQIIKDLTLEYNKLRQANITKELLEITTAQMAVG